MPNTITDNRTSFLGLPLPAATNDLSDDVERLIQAFTALDLAVHARATRAEVEAAVAALVNASPAALDTLNELAQALGNDPNFASTVMAAIAAKVPLTDVVSAAMAGKLLRLDSNGELPANSSSATKLKSARMVVLSGDGSGQGVFDGTADINIALTVAQASQTAAGKVELADDAETGAGTNSSLAVTPAGLASLRGVAGGLATLTAPGGVVPDSQLLSTGVTPGTYFAVTLDDKGRGTGGRALLPADIPLLTVSKLSDFDAQVRAYRLDQLAAPTAAVGMGGQRLTGLADPQSSQDAVTLAFAQALIQGLTPKGSVKVATTASITLSGLQTVDGVALAAGDRVLVKDQTTASQNGIYVVASGAWSRATDADTWDKLASAYVLVQKGTNNADTGYLFTVDSGGGTLGTTAITVVQFSGAGQIIAGAGLTKTGNQLDVGQGAGIAVGADSIGLTGQALALHNLASNGFFVRTAADTIAARSLAASGSGLSLANADGVAGNPTFSLTAALSSVGGLTPAADRLAYYTGASGAALATFTAWGRSLVAAANQAAGLSALGAAAASHTHASTADVTGLDTALASKLDKSGGTMSGAIELAADPATDMQPATKRWVESLSGKNSVRAATTGVIGGVTYATQTISARTTYAVTVTTSSGNAVLSITSAWNYIKVGATVSGNGIPTGATVTVVTSSTVTLSAAPTASTSVNLTFTNQLAALAIDGVTLALGDRVLVKDDATNRNGIYSLTTLGTASVAWVLTRTSDGDSWDDLVGASVAVEEGTANAETSWLCTANRGGTLGTTSIPWQLVSNKKLASAGANATSGFLVQKDASTVVARTVTAANASRMVIVNGDGVAGNPTIDLAPSVVPAGTYDYFMTDGYGLIVGAGNYFPPSPGIWFSGSYPIVAADGVMDVGRYIDFHATSGETSDYSVRLDASSSGVLVNTGVFRSASGSSSSTGYGFTASGSTGIYYASPAGMGFSAGGVVSVLMDSSGAYPGGDNSKTLGKAASRWSTVYAGTGTINTSDAREKTPVRALSPAELAAAKELAREIGTYQFLAAVADKGVDKARHHAGLTVQRAIEVMESHGLDPMRYGFICFDAWAEEVIEHPSEYQQVLIPQHMDDFGNLLEARYEQGPVIKDAWTETRQAGDRFSFRMDELLAFIARGLDARLSALEDALAALG